MRRVCCGSAWILVCLWASSPGLAQETTPKDRPDEETLRKVRQLEQQVAKQFQEKEYEAAAASCRELIRLIPQNPGPHYNLACASARLRKSDDAFSSLTQALEAGYAEALHLQNDDDLSNLREDKRFAALIGKARANRQKLLAALPLDKGAEIKGVKMVEGNPEEGLRYRLRLSEQAAPEKPHRLIVWLHPSGGSMNNVVESLAPRLAEHGFALLVLTQKQFQGWSEEDATQLFQKTLPDVGRLRAVDVRKPILLGYSAGGQMALELWYADPTQWGGLVLDAAYPVRLEKGKYVARPLPKSDAVKTAPVFVLVGDQDGGSALWKKQTPEWIEAGVPLTIRHIEGKGHTWLFGKEQIALLEKWLEEVAAGKLPADPREKE